MQTLEEIRSRIEALGLGFKFVKPIKTSMNGIERETWLLEYQGSQFVYVAGQKNVVLGWDVNKCPVGEGVIKGLRQDFADWQAYYRNEIDELREYYEEEIAEAKAAGKIEEAEKLCLELQQELQDSKERCREAGYENWEGFLNKWREHLSQCLSPLRTADIGDMLVEADSNYLEKDAATLEEAVHSLKAAPFTLATEDEWEYLCNGGARTLFRWGDSLEGVLEEIYGVGAVGTEGAKPLLEQPNMLGLFIAYDSYKNEIIDNIRYTKGGDGGGSLCGGDGTIYVLPCYTAFYRNPENKTYKLSKDYYAYRRIIRLP